MSVSMFYFWNFFPNEIEIRKKDHNLTMLCCKQRQSRTVRFKCPVLCTAVRTLHVGTVCPTHTIFAPRSTCDWSTRGTFNWYSLPDWSVEWVHYTAPTSLLCTDSSKTHIPRWNNRVLFNIRNCSFLVFCMNIMIYIWAFDINYGQQNGLIKMKMICSVGSTHIWENHIFITFKNVFMFFR